MPKKTIPPKILVQQFELSHILFTLEKKMYFTNIQVVLLTNPQTNKNVAFIKMENPFQPNITNLQSLDRV